MAKKCFGIGLVTVDRLILDAKETEPVASYVGGSCGNVMVLLALAGWECTPIARLGVDSNADFIIEDFNRLGVSTECIIRDPQGRTTELFQRNYIGRNGVLRHRFEFMDDKMNLSARGHMQFRPITIVQAEPFMDRLWSEKPALLYVDRLFPAAVQVAEKAHEAGSLVFYEPSEKPGSRNFDKCVAASDIIKFSDQRLADFGYFDSVEDKLIIQTLGEDGLKFRLNSGWINVSTVRNDHVLDTCGAGDATTAAFIDFLFKALNSETVSGEALLSAGTGKVKDCLERAGRVGAYSCGFNGARGVMGGRTWQEIIDNSNYL